MLERIATLTGFEKEIVDELARRMGRRPVHVRNDWDGLIPGLQTGAYDVAVNGIEISDDRARSVDFSLPYFRGYEQIVVRRGATGMRTLAELAGRRVGTLGQTLALELLERTPGVTAVKYDQELQAYADLAAGRLDAVLLDFPIAKYYAGPDPRLELVGEPVGEFRYGVALPKGSPLKREVDAAVAGMAADGTLRRILSRWDLWGPAQASLHNQPAAPDGPPSGYLEYVARTRAATPWTEKLARYWRHGTTATAVNFPQVDLPQVKDGLLRILHVHRNVPGVLGKMHTLLAKSSINIHAEFLQSDKDTSFVILDVDRFEDPRLLDGLRDMEETVRMRVAS